MVRYCLTTKLVLQVGLHLVCFPHIVSNDMFTSLLDFGSCATLVLLRNGCIRQMHELVFRVSWVIVLRSEPQIWRLPHPDRKWIDTGNNDPLPYIELFAKYDKRSLDIFLHDPDCCALPAMLLQPIHHFV